MTLDCYQKDRIIDALKASLIHMVEGNKEIVTTLIHVLEDDKRRACAMLDATGKFFSIPGQGRIQLIRQIREEFGLGLETAMDLVDDAQDNWVKTPEGEEKS